MKITDLLEAGTQKVFATVNSITQAEKLYSHAKGQVTIDTRYADYPSIDDQEIRAFTRYVRDAAKDVGGKFKKISASDLEFKITGVPAERLSEFFDSIESSFNEPGYSERGDQWGMEFDCSNEGLSETHTQSSRLDEAKKSKRKKRLKQGDKVRNVKSKAKATVIGPMFGALGSYWWPVARLIGGHTHESCWHDHDTHGTDGQDAPPPAPPAASMAGDLGGAPQGGGDAGGGGGE